MNKKLKILFFCMVFVGGSHFAKSQSFKKTGLLLSLQQKNLHWRPVFFVQPLTVSPVATPCLPPGFYASRLGFFCKQEIKLEKLIKVPIRFRLGSVEQCDWLEGKRRPY